MSSKPLALQLMSVVSAAMIFGPAAIAAEPLEEEFQSELDELRVEFEFPGATAAYVLPDGTVGTAATGFSDLEAGAPMRVDSRMLAASIGKTLVGATVIALAQEGKLGLDDPISEWLGDRRWFSRLPNHNRITVRHLLHHTSGIPDHVYMDSYSEAMAERWNKRGNPFGPESIIQFVLDKPALFEVGEGWEYTDTGYILLGLIIEKASGHSFYDEVIYRFIVPLRLSLTSPSDRVILPGLAAGYLPSENRFGLPEKTTITEGIMVWNPAREWTGGGFISNPRDLVVFAKALFEGRAMDEPYLEQLLTSVSTAPPEKDNVRYGAGVGIYKDDYYGTTYGHGGATLGYTSSMRYYKEHGIAVSFQINTDSGISGGHQMEYYYEMERRLAGTIIKNK